MTAVPPKGMRVGKRKTAVTARKNTHHEIKQNESNIFIWSTNISNLLNVIISDVNVIRERIKELYISAETDLRLFPILARFVGQINKYWRRWLSLSTRRRKGVPSSTSLRGVILILNNGRIILRRIHFNPSSFNPFTPPLFHAMENGYWPTFTRSQIHSIAQLTGTLFLSGIRYLHHPIWVTLKKDITFIFLFLYTLSLFIGLFHSFPLPWNEYIILFFSFVLVLLVFCYVCVSVFLLSVVRLGKERVALLRHTYIHALIYCGIRTKLKMVVANTRSYGWWLLIYICFCAFYFYHRP